MASDSGRRPKGVVECVRMNFCLVQAKEIRSPKLAPKLLTVIRGSEILGVLKSEKGFRAATFGGFFLLRFSLLFHC
jgi:hypothetical protein